MHINRALLVEQMKPSVIFICYPTDHTNLLKCIPFYGKRTNIILMLNIQRKMARNNCNTQINAYFHYIHELKHSGLANIHIKIESPIETHGPLEAVFQFKSVHFSVQINV